MISEPPWKQTVPYSWRILYLWVFCHHPSLISEIHNSHISFSTFGGLHTDDKTLCLFRHCNGEQDILKWISCLDECRHIYPLQCTGLTSFLQDREKKGNPLTPVCILFLLFSLGFMHFQYISLEILPSLKFGPATMTCKVFECSQEHKNHGPCL